jgi:hypothetical protein
MSTDLLLRRGLQASSIAWLSQWVLMLRTRGSQHETDDLAPRHTSERGLISDVDVFVLAMLLNGLFETLDALHEGRSGLVT